MLSILSSSFLFPASSSSGAMPSLLLLPRPQWCPPQHRQSIRLDQLGCREHQWTALQPSASSPLALQLNSSTQLLSSSKHLWPPSLPLWTCSTSKSRSSSRSPSGIGTSSALTFWAWLSSCFLLLLTSYHLLLPGTSAVAAGLGTPGPARWTLSPVIALLGRPIVVSMFQTPLMFSVISRPSHWPGGVDSMLCPYQVLITFQGLPKEHSLLPAKVSFQLPLSLCPPSSGNLASWRGSSHQMALSAQCRHDQSNPQRLSSCFALMPNRDLVHEACRSWPPGRSPASSPWS